MGIRKFEFVEFANDLKMIILIVEIFFKSPFSGTPLPLLLSLFFCLAPPAKFINVEIIPLSSRDGHNFFKRTKFFVKKGFVQKKLKMDERNGSIREMKKLSYFTKRMIY